MMTTGEIDELFDQTLTGNDDDDEPWKAVHTLRRMGTREVFEKAAEWCKSDNPLARARGADVLGQLGRTAEHPSNNFPEESYVAISALVQRETDLRPLASAIYAMGHLHNFAGVPLIANFGSHPHPDIRDAVAFSLGCFPNEPLSVATLLKLTDDIDEDIRNWATFGLGNLGDADSSEIRDALVRLLNDSKEDVREEAMVGLGKRKDPRVLAALLDALEQTNMAGMTIEAASLMLGMEEERKDWTAADYATALRNRFST
jgi:HEAT repeat protein